MKKLITKETLINKLDEISVCKKATTKATVLVKLILQETKIREAIDLGDVFISGSQEYLGNIIKEVNKLLRRKY